MNDKIIQKNYPQLEIVNSEKDHVQIWNNESDPQVIHVERENIEQLINMLYSCNAYYNINQKQEAIARKKKCFTK